MTKLLAVSTWLTTLRRFRWTLPFVRLFTTGSSNHRADSTLRYPHLFLHLFFLTWSFSFTSSFLWLCWLLFQFPSLLFFSLILFFVHFYNPTDFFFLTLISSSLPFCYALGCSFLTPPPFLLLLLHFFHSLCSFVCIIVLSWLYSFFRLFYTHACIRTRVRSHAKTHIHKHIYIYIYI